MKPPTMAPLIESSPPRMTAGKARRAKKRRARLEVPRADAGRWRRRCPPRVARTAAMAHAMAKTRADRMPCSHGRLLVEGGGPHGDARCASGRSRPTATKAARAPASETTWVWGIRTPPMPKTSRPNGFAHALVWSCPRKSLTRLRRAMSRPRVMMATEKSGSPTIGRIATRSRSAGRRCRRRRARERPTAPTGASRARPSTGRGCPSRRRRWRRRTRPPRRWRRGRS